MLGVYVAVDFFSIFQNVDFHCGFLIWHQQQDGSFLLMREEQNYILRQIQDTLEPDELAEIKAQFGCAPS